MLRVLPFHKALHAAVKMIDTIVFKK